ncbi:NDR1/HIN1-like protein 10 [Asparagus officinalis]|uniref:NDR1/HIN1-like protein 10 n=1 Tax=Asparagus officinalis TaxID=4686 RepID=UPI00098E7BDF|nr:NDR1/HIN1-like protein 10 [Asparagus officinalis]
MAQQPKEAYLNESYYGPTIPADQPTQRPRIPSTMHQCSPYALLCHAFKALTIVIIVIGITVLTLWLIYTPQPLKVYVESANLTRFDLNDSSLSFNLYANLTVRNPNKRGEIYYKHVQATAFYNGDKLEDIILPLFHQQKKNTTAFDLSYIGGPLKVGPSVNETYGREKDEGWFYVGVKFYTKVRLRMIIINSVEYAPQGDCELRLPAPTNETSMKVGFQRTKCHVDQFT